MKLRISESTYCSDLRVEHTLNLTWSGRQPRRHINIILYIRVTPNVNPADCIAYAHYTVQKALCGTCDIHSERNIFSAGPLRTTVHSCQAVNTRRGSSAPTVPLSTAAQAHQPHLHRPWWLHETSYKPERNGLTRVARYVCARPGDYEPARCPAVYRRRKRTWARWCLSSLSLPSARMFVLQDRVYTVLLSCIFCIRIGGFLLTIAVFKHFSSVRMGSCASKSQR